MHLDNKYLDETAGAFNEIKAIVMPYHRHLRSVSQLGAQQCQLLGVSHVARSDWAHWWVHGGKL